MKRRVIIETRKFTKAIEAFLKRGQLLRATYDNFKNELLTNPESGDRISGTNGVRKIRISSSSKGKSGGFRICFYYLKEDLTMNEKMLLKEFVLFLKGAQNG